MATVQQAFDLALQHHQAGRLAEADALYRQILAVQPDHAGAWHYLGVLAYQAGRHADAVQWINRALVLDPTSAAAYSNLGAAYQRLGRPEEAIAAYRRAMELQPDLPQAHVNLANALRDLGKLPEATDALEEALRLDCRDPVAHYNLGNTLKDLGRADEAIAAFRQTLELKLDYFEAWSNLGSTLKDQGQLEEALAAFRRGLEIVPGHAGLHSNIVYLLQYLPETDDEMVAREHQRWNRQFAEPLRQMILPHGNDPAPERRLRVGYVSPDFCFQSEANFVVPLLEAHDHRQWEIHCYASVARPDAVTERLRRCADVWHDVLRVSDHDLAARIRADGIDILVNLTMHMGRNRLLTFARQPAPVQVTWLAYPGSTGLPVMDYRLTDRYLDPPEGETSCYAEKSVALPDCWCCYDPLTDEPPVNDLPANTTGRVTFGCLNNFCKINAQVVGLFGDVLRAVDGSRLLLLAPEGSARWRILDQMRQQGVSPERIEFVPKTSRLEYLRLYQRIDIALDTLPYNGITTTCDALWMGVPVITLAGKTAAGRAGQSLLSAVQLAELATRNAEEFVQAARQLADDLPRRATLRRDLRPRMEASVLMDAPRFARNIEAAYRAMWRHWCEGSGS